MDQKVNHLEEKEGLYTPGLRFAFTNITDEPFTSKWNGVPVVVGPHETIEINDTTPLVGLGMGQNLAFKFRKELVDKIMLNDFKSEELKANQPYYRSPRGMSLGVPAARKPLEDKILRLLGEEEESPAKEASRKQFIDQLTADHDRPQGKVDDRIEPTPAKVEEFSQIKNAGVVAPTKTKAAAKTKKIKVTEPVASVA